MAKESGAGKGSRSAKTGKSATAGKTDLDRYFERIATVIPRMRYNARTKTLTVGKYRRVSPHVDVTKR